MTSMQIAATGSVSRSGQRNDDNNQHTGRRKESRRPETLTLHKPMSSSTPNFPGFAEVLETSAIVSPHRQTILRFFRVVAREQNGSAGGKIKTNPVQPHQPTESATKESPRWQFALHSVTSGSPNSLDRREFAASPLFLSLEESESCRPVWFRRSLSPCSRCG